MGTLLVDRPVAPAPRSVARTGSRPAAEADL